MPNFQLFIPGGAQQGSSIAAADFAQAADELLDKALPSDTPDELAAQARAAVEAAKALVAAGHAGADRVLAVITSRINPDAVPAGTGHVISIELSSRAAAAEEQPAEAPEQPAAPAVPDESGVVSIASAEASDKAEEPDSGKAGSFGRMR